LSPDGVRSLAAGSGLDLEGLYRLTGGNPFYVTEVLAAGTIGPGVPLSARDAVLARAARLSDESWAVLSCASLIGARIEPALLIAATRCPAAVLDKLLSCGLLVDDGTALRFRHEIARLAVEQQLPSHRRTVLHAQILAALRSSSGGAVSADDARMAFHAEGAGDDAAVLHHAARAAELAAELGAHREAAAQYQRALRAAASRSAGADLKTAARLYSGLAVEAALGDAIQVAADAD